MSAWILSALGLVLLLATMLDLIWSILSTQGAGPIARVVTSIVWLGSRTLRTKTSVKGLSKLTPLAILGALFFTWITLLWISWLFIFTSAPLAVLIERNGEAATLLQRVNFVGGTLFTLGSTEYVPGNARWSFLSVLAGMNGLTMVTLIITYLLPIVSAAVDRRQIALTIWGLGPTTEEIIKNGWNHGSFQVLETQLYQLALQLLTHSERHVAYPVLQYFSASSPRADLSPRIASLDDAVTILAHAIPAHLRPAQTVLHTLRKAIREYLRRIEETQIKLPEEPPELPDFDALRRAQIPLVQDDEIKANFDELKDHRRLLYGFVKADGWKWGD